MKKKKFKRKKEIAIQKTGSREKRNRNKYKIENRKKEQHYGIIILLLFSLLANGFLIFHYATFDHNKVKIVTKTKEIITVSPNYLFLGDSITDFYDLNKYFPNQPVVNSGISGNTTEDILNDMNHRIYQYNPSHIFLLIGTNDIANGKSPDEVVTNIKEIVNQVKEKKQIVTFYIESIYPVNDTVNKSIVGQRNNEDIIEINNQLKKFCEENEITYIDMFSILADDNGNLKEEYTKDGLHISDIGYERITKELETYLN